METEIIEVELPKGTVNLVIAESERRGETVGQFVECAVNSLLLREDFP
jgi:hypothetical protein